MKKEVFWLVNLTSFFDNLYKLLLVKTKMDYKTNPLKNNYLDFQDKGINTSYQLPHLKSYDPLKPAKYALDVQEEPYQFF